MVKNDKKPPCSNFITDVICPSTMAPFYQNQNGQRKKIVMVGDGGVGKSTFVKRLLEGSFDPKYIATLGVDVHVYNNHLIWDCAGQDKFSGLGEGYYINADEFIIMIDCTSRHSLTVGLSLFERIRILFPIAPILFILNKIDRDEKTVFIDEIPNEPLTSKIEMSQKTGYNFSISL